MRILITAPYNEPAQKVLAEALGEIIYRPWKQQGRAYNTSELIRLLSENNAEALITEHDEVTEEVIRACPNLQFIGVCRGTPSNVSLKAAAQKDIPVFHTPARNAQAVAEMFVSNVIMFLRNTVAGSTWLNQKHWREGTHASYLQFKGNELAGKTIGMVGFGAVGQRIAKLVKEFPCDIRYYDPYLDPGPAAYESASLETIFKNSDIVSVNLPVTDQTKDIIGKKYLSMMKKSAVLVNMSRAVVINREDLLDTLERGLIRGAVLDVFYNEPPDTVDYKIIDHKRVLATPHIAGATFEVEDHHATIMNAALLDHFAALRKGDLIQKRGS